MIVPERLPPETVIATTVPVMASTAATATAIRLRRRRRLRGLASGTSVLGSIGHSNRELSYRFGPRRRGPLPFSGQPGLRTPLTSTQPVGSAAGVKTMPPEATPESFAPVRSAP
ncbi:unannotated protein [freshwater metagenome]|uniref:Unannotated protein n=1 Tax=freshwater metagenome TaxID=449393 RepID=A0A6J6A7U5_9ZZZZ